MRTITRTTFAGLVVTGGLALSLPAGAQAAVPTQMCGAGATFTVRAGDGIDAALLGSVRAALSDRGLTATDGTGDLVAVIAPASEVVQGGDPSVMAVSLSAEPGGATPAVEGSDWAPAMWTDGATAVNTLLDEACGPQESSAPVDGPAEAPGEDTGALTADETASLPAAQVAPPALAAPTAVPAPAVAAAPSAPNAGGAKAPAVLPSRTEVSSTAPQAATARPAAVSASAQVEAGASTTKVSVSIADRDCPDFPTQAQAQSFFTAHGGPAADPHRLDADDDGIACESHFAGDESAPNRAEARTISAGVPDAAGTNAGGLLGGALLALSGLGVAACARRSG